MNTVTLYVRDVSPVDAFRLEEILNSIARTELTDLLRCGPWRVDAQLKGKTNPLIVSFSLDLGDIRACPSPSVCVLQQVEEAYKRLILKLPLNVCISPATIVILGTRGVKMKGYLKVSVSEALEA